MLKALEWQEANPIQAQSPTDWTNGAYYTGVAKAHQSTGNREFLTALIDMGQRNNWQPWERYYHADDLVITYPYLYLVTIGVKEVDLKPTEKIIEEHLYKPHAWKEGEREMEKILWWWCDALFMAPPALTLYAELEDNQKYLDEMHKYYMETYNLLYDKEEHLFARDNRFLWKGEDSDKKEENGKKIFWSRGNGWVLGGLALILENMPKNYEHRPFYVNLYKEMAAKIKEIQPASGLWHTSLLSPESYDHGEVSGSGFFTFALAWGINNGLLDKAEYSPVVNKTWKGLQAAQQESGKVGWVQNIGAEPKPATKDSWQNYGTGAFLLAGSEMLKLK
ncbi:family 88 glycosyl hydrolase [Gramella sp. AN32]|nr:family 88 glycosyl hydrolase [Gramella sp. AN32]